MSELHTQIIPRKKAKSLGIKRYFTGKPCKHGHLCEKNVSDGKCMECARRWKSDNREHIIKQKQKYRDDNRELVRESHRIWKSKNPGYDRRYYQENRDKVLEKNRKYYSNNKDYVRETNRQWRSNNKDKIRSYYVENREHILKCGRKNYFEKRDIIINSVRQWRKENPNYFKDYYAANRERYSAHASKRRAAKMNRTLSYSEELTHFATEEAIHQAKDMEGFFGMTFHVDHIIPLQGGKVSGLHVWYNLQVIPATLNKGKGNRMKYTQPLEWLADCT